MFGEVSMADKFIIGIDLGTSSAKVGVFSMYGKAFGWESGPLPLHLLPNGGAEQDPRDWWNAIRLATKRLLARAIVPRERIVAICASTAGAGTVPVDREGNCLARAMTWLDTRGAEYTRRIAGGIAAGYDPIKLVRWLRLTGGAPSLSGKDSFGHQLYVCQGSRHREHFLPFV
jgi:xylulokinase